MTRKQFLNDLYLRLTALGPERAEQHLTYYAEMLADRMEEGMSEEEAVASMEDLDTIARRILEEEGQPEEPQPVMPPACPDASRIPGGGGTRAYQPPKKWDRRKLIGAALWTAAAVVLVGTVARYANDRRAERTATMDWLTEDVPPMEEAVEQAAEEWENFSYLFANQGDMQELQPDQVQSISIQCSTGSVRVWESGEGTVQYGAEEGQLSWQLEDGHLTLRPAGNYGDLVVYCPSGLLDRLEISTVSANVVMDYMDVGSLEIATISGDVDLCGFYADAIGLTSTSGDLYLSDVQTGALNMRNTSGEIDFYNGAAVECHAETISGGIDLELNGTNEIYTSSTSGDLELTLDGTASLVSCVTKSGDVELEVPEDLEFTLTYNTISGDLESSLPLTRSGDSYACGAGGPESIEVNTTSGDLYLEAY